MQDKKVKLEPLMSKTFRFSEYKDAYEYIDQNKASSMKILIDVQG